MARHYHDPVSWAEARSVACPRCLAPRYQPCVRIYRDHPGTGPEVLGREATPARPSFEPAHQERCLAARAARFRAVGQKAPGRPPVAGPPARDPALLLALQDHDRREHDQLRSWLARNADLFTTLTTQRVG